MELAAERIAGFLRRRGSQAFCVGCLESLLGIERHQAQRGFLAVTRASDFYTELAVCSECGHRMATLRLQYPDAAA